MNINLPITPEDWLIHAQSDLNLAKLGSGDKKILPEQICFHAQQTLEKSLKALLLYLKSDFPLTHDLEELVDIIKLTDVSVPSFFNDAGTLTPYAVETRYPGIWGEITEVDVKKAINLSEQILEWVKSYISDN